MPTVESSLKPVLELYEKGLFLQAHAAAAALGPLDKWPGTEGRLLAGRLATVLGGMRRGGALHLRAWRADPENLRAILYGAHTLLDRRGPWEAWQVLSRVQVAVDAEPSDHASFHALCARVLSLLRDFDAAEQALGRADEVDAGHAWNQVERCYVLTQQDRYDEALEAARRAMELRRWLAAGVMGAAHLLQLLDRDEEAIALMTEALDHIEAGPVAAQLAALQMELGRHPEAMQSLERFERLSPMLDRPARKWLFAQRAEAAYAVDDPETAARAADQVEGSTFHEKMAEKLRSGAPARRRILPLAFVRQRHMTCGPATLAALGRFFDEPTDHLGVADEICYGGTTHYSQRRWALDNGFVAREFTLNVADTEALIDRGVPFAVSTFQSTMGHMQAVMGYDARLGTLHIRDPYLRNSLVFLGDGFVEHYRSCGPRALVVVPSGRADLLEGLELKDEELYDLFYELQERLEAHDHDGAYAVYRRLRERAPDDLVTIQARQALSSYEGDSVGVLSCLERLLQRFPGDSRIRLQQLGCLLELGRRDERLEVLEKLVAEPGADPVFLQMLAQQLGADARAETRALRLLRRALRRAPTQAACYFTMANLLWNAREFDRALELYRFASCLQDTDERLAGAYFTACCARGRAGDALALLRDRFTRFARLSGHPAMSLFTALDQLERTTEGFDVLEEALRARPVDGELLLFAADAHGRYGDDRRAEELLARAGHVAKATERLAAEARLASYRGQPEQALRCWREVVRIDPLNDRAQSNVAFTLEQTAGRAAALEHLRDAAHTYPFRKGLQVMYAQWLAEDHPEEAEGVLRGLLERDPADAWCHRELALRLGQQGRLDEALVEADASLDLEPNNAMSHGVRGRILGHMGRFPEAREAHLEALTRDVDYTPAFADLMRFSQSDEDRLQALALLRRELAEQTSTGEGVLAWWQYARHYRDGDEILKTLAELEVEQPGLWQVRSAWVQQLLAQRRLDEAVTAARQAAAEFPLLPKLWLDLAEVCHARSDDAGEVEALERALSINPTYGPALRQLSRHHRGQGDLSRSKSLLEHAVARDPLDAENHAWLAEVLSALGETEDAAHHLGQAVRLEPGFEWAWGALQAHGAEMGRDQLAGDLARELTRERPGKALVWLTLAKVLQEPAELEERLRALERASELRPDMLEPYDIRAQLLAEAGRYDEAVEVCRAHSNHEEPVTVLAGRLAWIEAQRGDLEGAVAGMRRILARDPSYQWGWEQLLGWLSAGDRADWLASAEEYVRAQPFNAEAHRHLARAKRKAGDRQGAAESLQRALAVAPTHEAALAELFWLQLGDDDTEAAAVTLAHIEQHAEGLLPEVCRVQHACAREARESASTQAAVLLSRTDAEPWAVRSVVLALRKTGMGDAVSDLIQRALEDPDAPAWLASLWIDHLLEDSQLRECRGVIDKLKHHPRARIEAGRALLEGLADRKASQSLSRFVTSEGRWLRSDPGLWGATASALLEATSLDRAADWVSSWREQDGLEPWALVTAGIVLRCVGRWEEAHEVCKRADALPPDVSRPVLRLWLGVDAFLAGRTDEARQMLQTCNRQELTVDQQFLFDVLYASLLAFQGGRSERAASFLLARRWFDDALRAPVRERRRTPLRKVYRKCVLKVARRRGTPGAWLWAVRKYFQ